MAAPTPLFLPAAAGGAGQQEQKLLLQLWEMLILADCGCK